MRLSAHLRRRGGEDIDKHIQELAAQKARWADAYCLQHPNGTAWLISTINLGDKAGDEYSAPCADFRKLICGDPGFAPCSSSDHRRTAPSWSDSGRMRDSSFIRARERLLRAMRGE
jgi:hypothetical protein